MDGAKATRATVPPARGPANEDPRVFNEDNKGPILAGRVADGLRQWPGAGARASYGSRACFQPGCSQFPLPAHNKGWTINGLAQAGRRERPFLAMRQLEEEQHRQRNLRLWARRSQHKHKHKHHQDLCTHVQHRIRPGTCVFKAGHAKKGPSIAVSCHAITFPFCPDNPGAWNSFLAYPYRLFFLKECLPQMGTISFYTSNQVYLTLKENW